MTSILIYTKFISYLHRRSRSSTSSGAFVFVFFENCILSSFNFVYQYLSVVRFLSLSYAPASIRSRICSCHPKAFYLKWFSFVFSLSTMCYAFRVISSFVLISACVPAGVLFALPLWFGASTGSEFNEPTIDFGSLMVEGVAKEAISAHFNPRMKKIQKQQLQSKCLGWCFFT